MFQSNVPPPSPDKTRGEGLRTARPLVRARGLLAAGQLAGRAPRRRHRRADRQRLHEVGAGAWAATSGCTARPAQAPPWRSNCPSGTPACRSCRTNRGNGSASHRKQRRPCGAGMATIWLDPDENMLRPRPDIASAGPEALAEPRPMAHARRAGSRRARSMAVTRFSRPDLRISGKQNRTFCAPVHPVPRTHLVRTESVIWRRARLEVQVTLGDQAARRPAREIRLALGRTGRNGEQREPEWSF
jgi:hypothetical protein